MQLKVFSIYDEKAEAYLKPFFMRSQAEAIRAFTDLVNDPQSDFFKHSEDFILFEIGDYNDHSGHISSPDSPKVIGKALEFKQLQNRASEIRPVDERPIQDDLVDIASGKTEAFGKVVNKV